MLYRPLGTTGIDISALALGAGPVPGLLTGDDAERQRQVVRRALDAGVNWFDTAASYGDGQSESNLGRTLRSLDALEAVHVATKVRLLPDQLDDIPGQVERSVHVSLGRLGLRRLTLVQIHNAITRGRGDEPTSLTPHDVLGPRGVLAALTALRERGLIEHLGLTGTGQAEALREVIHSGHFQVIQLPYNLLNPSAGQPVGPDLPETDYGNIIADCAAQRMGVLAIRVFAGGALAGQPPSPHTFKTPFFPLDLYQRDQQRSAALATALPPHIDLREAALRFVLSHSDVAAAIVGWAEPEQVDEALACLEAGPLPDEWLVRLRSIDHVTGRLPGGPLS